MSLLIQGFLFLLSRNQRTIDIDIGYIFFFSLKSFLSAFSGQLKIHLSRWKHLLPPLLFRCCFHWPLLLILSSVPRLLQISHGCRCRCRLLFATHSRTLIPTHSSQTHSPVHIHGPPRVWVLAKINKWPPVSDWKPAENAKAESREQKADEKYK